MWKTTAKWSLIVFLLAYICIMTVWARAEATHHECKGIEVIVDGKGNVSSITPESVEEVLKGYPEKITGMPIHAVNTLAIAQYLRKFNNFESVDCLITTKGFLQVKVVPMIPEIRVFDGDKSYYVNKDGKVMTAVPGFFVDVPVVSGKFTDKFRPESLLPVIRFIREDSLLNSITGMVVANDNENIIIVPRIKGHVINLGDASRLKEKRDAVFTAYKSIMPYKGWETYDTISVKFKGQIIATRRDKKPLYPIIPIVDEEDLEESSLATGVLESGQETAQQNHSNEPQNN